MSKDRSIEELYESIEAEVEFVDLRPYSHNIISILLREIARKYGTDKANKTIDKFGLEKLGWKKEVEKGTTK